MFGIWWQGKRKDYDLDKAYAFVKKVTKAANRAGRVTIESHGVENIPKENGFIFFPNHQGLFDVLAFLESCSFFFCNKERSKSGYSAETGDSCTEVYCDRQGRYSPIA